MTSIGTLEASLDASRFNALLVGFLQSGAVGVPSRSRPFRHRGSEKRSMKISHMETGVSILVPTTRVRT